MNEARMFTKLADVGELVAIACTPDGSIVGVNDGDGRVWFYAVVDADEQPEPLPLRFTRADASGVLLHPDGRVISYRSDGELRVRVHDPHTATELHSFTFAAIEPDEPDEDDEDDEDDESAEGPSTADGFHFDVAILHRPPPLEWLLPLEIANHGREGSVDWMSGLPDELRHSDMYPNRFTRMALHPNGRYLAVLERGTWILDLDRGALVNTLEYGIDEASLFEYGEGTHTIGFDDRGLLAIASVAISGNPFLQVDRVDVETGAIESSTENWRQCWGEPDAPDLEVHVYDPTSHLPPERIPEGTYKLVFRRHAIELWSRAGLQRSIPVAARACVIPSFDPSSFCADPHALLVTDDQLELLELTTGDRSARRPPIDEPWQTSRLTHIGFDASRRRVLLWRDQVALLAAPISEDRWGVCELPEGRSMRDWAFASETGRAFVADDAGELWLGNLAPRDGQLAEPRSLGARCQGAARSDPQGGSLLALRDGQSDPQPGLLQQLERELIANPHDPTPFLIYADALSERGDLRGEVIMLQHHGALDDAFVLLERNPDALIGLLAQVAPANFELRWELGHVRAAQFHIVYHELGLVLGFLASEAARLIEHLELQVEPRSNVDDVLAIYANIDAYLAAARHLPLLRSLTLGRPGEHTLSHQLLAALNNPRRL